MKTNQTKGIIAIHPIHGLPIVLFYKGGRQLSALVAVPAAAVATRLVGMEVTFTLDNDYFGTALHSEVGYALIDRESLKTG